MTKIRACLAALALLCAATGVFALPAHARPYTCWTNCIGNSCTTQCF